ncbi:MAG: dynamin family protein [Terriglobales bacterium]|jgi:GTP-binding protein EngB required for normal cell division
MPEESANSLNSNHERRLSVTCRYIDKLLADMENILNVSSSKLAFPQYTPDLTSAQRRVVEDYISRIRAQLIRVLDGQNIERPPADIPVARSLHSTLTFVDITVEELRPEYMRGYGEVPPQAAVELNSIAGELQGLVRQLDQYLMRSADENLQRLEKLEQTGDEVPLLRRLGTIIAEDGRVEFRSTLPLASVAFEEQQGSPENSHGESALLRLGELAEEFEAEQVAADAQSVAERVSEGRFYVACIGQFKRGKSSVLNALVGDIVLPTGVVPVTTVPTIVRYGSLAAARVRFEAGGWTDIPVKTVDEYVSEEKNPENAKHVAALEIFVPSPLLATGMCFVDTPGLGSVFTGNTAATRAFIPHIDAALVVIGADPPLAGEELVLIEAVARHVQDLIITVNKADRTTDAERAAAVAFARRQLEKRLQHSVGPLFEVSAAEQLEHRGTGRDWGKLVAALKHLVQGSGRRLIRAACERGVERISEQLLVIITEEREALQRPIEESESRINVMKQTIADAERSMRELGYLFMAEQQHLSDVFVGRHKAFLARAMPQASKEFDVALQSISCWLGPRYRRRIFREAQEIARRHVVPWLKPEQEEAEKEYRRVALRFVEMANEFLKKLANAGIPELARMPHALDPESGFRVRSEFTFLEFIEVAQPASPLRWLADLTLGLVGARKIIKNDAQRFLARLLEFNSTRVQSDILNRLQESRGKLETEIRKLLHEVSRIAEQALARAKKVREEGAPAVAAELRRLDSLEQEVRALGLLGISDN